MSNISKNNTKTSTLEGGLKTCRLYKTVIAREVAPGVCVLSTGGWNTQTTVRRINQCLDAWGYLSRVSGKSFSLADSITVIKQIA